MDVIRTIYKELFNIRLVHKAFASANGSEIFNQLTVTPDEETKVLFDRLEIGYRCVDDSIVCFVRSELVSPPAKEPKTSFVTFDADVKVRFLLSASPSFLSKTYAVATGSSEVYYFTNTINNIQSANLYLTKVIESYNAVKSYDEGTIVNSGGEPFVTLKPVNAADSISIGNTDFWKKILPAEQVVNNADLADANVVKPNRTCFAVIDVFRTGTTNATYDLFNGSENLMSPVYVLPFKSKL